MEENQIFRTVVESILSYGCKICTYDYILDKKAVKAQKWVFGSELQARRKY
jgi:hypothetical protein